MFKQQILLVWVGLLVGGTSSVWADDPDFQQVQVVLTKYCAGCHNDDDANGDLALDRFESLLRGGASGNALTPGSAASSRMVQMMRHQMDPVMPPEGEAVPSDDDIQLIADWIDAGAPDAEGERNSPIKLKTPSIESRSDQRPITALAFSPDDTQLAVGRFGRLEMVRASDLQPIGTFDQLPGKVSSIEFAKDGARVFVATGVTGLSGEIVEIDLKSGPTRVFRGHRDLAYAVDVNRDGTKLLSAGYDRRALIWDLTLDAPELQSPRELNGHNGAVFDAEFDPESEVVVTASADATVKVWSVDDGSRLDTRGEPLGEQYTVEISPDGKWIASAGADHRIRKWRLRSRTRSMINPLQVARFAHESPIEKLEFHPSGRWLVSASDDHRIKIWDFRNVKEVHSFPRQPVNVQAIAVSRNRIAVGRMDGTLELLAFPKLAATSVSESSAPYEDSTVGQPVSIESEQTVNKLVESEPNDRPGEALIATVPFEMSGKIFNSQEGQDRDLVRFSAAAGQTLIMEIKAARVNSPLDSHIAVLDDQGQPVPRVKLQAVRDSYFTFRGKDSRQINDFRIHNWEEMQIGQMLYCNGEVVRLYHYPRGPDSGFNVFPNFGRRHALFDTTPITHALNEPCYVVEAFPPDANLVESGLPTFLLHYENDDDARQELGKDSRLTFTAPRDGDYIVCIKDVRGFSGDDFHYQLNVRAPQPGFAIGKVNGGNPKIARGTYQKIGVDLERIDGFEDAVEIDVENLPPGFSVLGPTSVEPGGLRAWMVIHADDQAQSMEEKDPPVQIVARATIQGKSKVIRKPLGKLEVLEKTPLRVQLLGNVDDHPETKLPVIEIQAGSTVSTHLKVERITHQERINFGKENAGQNFPFGVYVDNIGLNGVLIPPGESERTIFITAEPFVEPGETLVFLEAEEAGRPASNPVILRVLPQP